MSKNTYSYPPDEFDQVDMNSRPKEVHAASRGVWSHVWPFLLVIVLVPTVAFLAVHFLADNDPSAGPDPTTPAPTGDQQPTEPVDEPTDDPVPPEPTTPEPPPPTVDYAVVVTVYNGGGTEGAAGRAAEKLRGAGFAQAASKQQPNPAKPTAATIYYSSQDQIATAQEIATLLGAAVTLDAQVAQGGIVAVIF
ncbi:MAG: LytR C-terminal domain-containing protein [Bifidobacteriaceae bacterium]|nr:LytR C-terminal domain-containing protein [Bifidobacteriaceae bacterium]